MIVQNNNNTNTMFLRDTHVAEQLYIHIIVVKSIHVCTYIYADISMYK